MSNYSSVLYFHLSKFCDFLIMYNHWSRVLQIFMVFVTITRYLKSLLLPTYVLQLNLRRKPQIPDVLSCEVSHSQRLIGGTISYAIIVSSRKHSAGAVSHEIVPQQVSEHNDQIDYIQSFSRSFGLGSAMPFSVIAKRQSLSGKQGLS